MSKAVQAPSLDLPAGRIEGARIPGGSEGPDLHVYRGIPYAAPPVGVYRWQPPASVQSWSGTRDCTAFGPVALQAIAPGKSGVTGSLDCLSLNIWAPQAAGGPLPVLVWVPGGGFIRGGASDALYDGSAIAQQGIVFVSLNYRIGVEGFMHFDDAAANRGLQDQVAALRWVQDHIALFGGDPKRVTVGGVSAGAGSLTHLMGLAGSAGLFQRVLLQSPSLQSHSLEDSQRIKEALAGVLNVAPTREAMAALSPELLASTLATFLGNEPLKKAWGLRPRNYFPVRPVVDGCLVETEPLQAINRQLSSGAIRWPVLLGCNAQEMRFYLVPDGTIDRITEGDVLAFLSDIDWSADVLAEYRSRMPDASMGDLLSSIQSDYYYIQPTETLERALRQAGCTTYRYKFAWPSPLYGGRMGAAHAMEIPFALGNAHLSRAVDFIGASAPPSLALDMHNRWVRFVKGE